MYGTEWDTCLAASPQEPVAVRNLGFAEEGMATPREESLSSSGHE
jgi:hypothetical protein